MSGTGVLVLGSANMDVVLHVDAFPSAGETVLGSHSEIRPGGKGANQAVAAAVAGAKVAFAGRVGADAHGRALIASLQGVGVDVTALTVADDAATGLAVVLIAADGENAIAVASGANYAMRAQDVDALQPEIAAAAVLLLQMELPAAVAVRAAQIAASVSTTVVLNLAPALSVPPELLAAVDVLVVNTTEAGYLVGSEPRTAAEREAAAATLLTRGPTAVVITAGADGALLATADGSTHLPALPVAVFDTTGAGDAFVGVLAGHLSAGESLLSAATAAIRAAAAAVSTSGSQLTRASLAEAHD